MAEFSSSDGDHMSPKASNVYYLAFTEKNVLIPALDLSDFRA